MKIDFQHIQSAHCENGVISNLLRFHGVEISEAMVFGIGAGLFFTYLPFMKLDNIPITSFRPAPGVIFSRFTRRLGIKVKKQKFRNPDKAMDELDRTLEKGIPAGLQVGAYFLPYFPVKMRFHFNMHNIVAYGKEDGKYLISDPVFPEPVDISYQDLRRVRFAKGPMAPKGKMYYPVKIPEKIDLRKPVIKGIRKVCHDMLKIPIPLMGVRGIRYLSRQVRVWPEKIGNEKAALYLGQVIRMQEEIGTGGAGFRFIFASFLQEAADVLEQDWLWDASQEMTDIGDRWREFALLGARNCKGRATPEESYSVLADILLECADREEKLFRKLDKISLKKGGCEKTFSQAPVHSP